MSKSKVEEMNMKMKMKISSIRIKGKCCKKSFRTTYCLFLLAMSDFFLKNIVLSSKFESSLTASQKTCYSPKVTCNTLYKVTATEFEPTTIQFVNKHLVHLRTTWLLVRSLLLSLELQILHLFQARSSLTFRQLQSVASL